MIRPLDVAALRAEIAAHQQRTAVNAVWAMVAAALIGAILVGAL